MADQFGDLENFDEVFDFDISDVAIPEGVHRAVVMKAEIRQGPKAPYIWTELTLVDPPLKGEMVWYNMTLSSTSFARRRTKRDLEGILGSRLEGKKSVASLVKALPGKPCTLVVKTGEYQGESRPEVQRILACKGNGPVVPGMESEGSAPSPSGLDDLPF